MSGANITVSPTTSTTYTIVGLSDASGCSGTGSGTAIVTVNQPPTTSNAGASQTITTGSSATLAANTPTSGTGSWSVTSGPSTNNTQFSSTTNPAATFTPAGGVGAYVLTWTISNPPCTPSASSLTLTVSAPASPTCGTLNVPADYPTIQAAVSAACPGAIIQVASGTYNEQVSIGKSLTITGVGATKPVINFTGTPGLASTHLTLFDVTAPNVTIENLQFTPDLTKVGSAILASVSLPGSVSGLAVQNNTINPYQSGGLVSYGLRNAVSINYADFRVNGSNPSNLLITGNTITYNDNGTVGNANDDAGFRSGVATDEGGGTFTGNTIQTINQDIQARFGSAGAITVTNNNINGGGVELTEYNAGATVVTVSGNNFNGAFGSTFSSSLRLKNNTQAIPTTVSGNNFTGHNLGISLENYQAVTINNNTFTPATNSTTYRHIVEDTKEGSSSSGTFQPMVSLTLTNNTFNGSGAAGGTGLAFYNQDNDNPVFGTFTLGTSGNENNFTSGLGTFIYLDGSTGTANPNATPVAPFAVNLSAINNRFDVGAGLQLPNMMTAAQRATLETKLYHKPDNAALGLITYFNPVQNLTQNQSYSTIQSAVDAANAGDVIQLAEYTFYEHVNVTKPLTVTGISQTGTIIDGFGQGPGNGFTLSDNVSGITIQNLTVKNQIGTANITGNGIRGQTNNNLTISGVVSVSNAIHGIILETSGTLTNVSVTSSTLSSNGIGNGGRGFIIFNNLKQNITVSNNLVQNNGLSGIDINEGTVTGTTITSNTVTGNGDGGLSLLGALDTGGANRIADNVITNSGRYGMEVKSSLGTGATSGAGSLVIENNTVSGATNVPDDRDVAGISVTRRAAAVSVNNKETPQGAVVRNNTVSGFVNSGNGDGFGIVVEGVNYQVTGNNVTGNDVGIQEQQTPIGQRGRTNGLPSDGDSPYDVTDYFDRGNSIYSCGVVTANTLSGNTINMRAVGATAAGRSLVTNTNTGVSYCTIQAAVDAANAGDVLSASAGTFTEDVYIDKAVTLNGANASINPNTGTRVPETILVPATSGSTLVYLADGLTGVSIKGFTFDGNNPALTGTPINGVDVDGSTAISSYSSVVSGVKIDNNIIQNFADYGIILDPDNLNGAPATDGHEITHNKIDNIGAGSGLGILLQNNAYAIVTNNVITRIRAGVQTGNFYRTAPTGTTPAISTNTISAQRVAIFHNLQYQVATPFTIANNTLSVDATAQTFSVVPRAGLLLASLGVPATISGNTVGSGFLNGVEAWGNSGEVTLSGGMVQGNLAGILLPNRNSFGDASGKLTVSGVTITNSPVGVQLTDNPAVSAGISVSVTITNNTQISSTGTFTAVAISGADATANISGNASSFLGNGSSTGVDINGGTASINANRISSFGMGINVSNGGQLTGAANNFITGNTTGIAYTADASTTQGMVTNNDLSGNTGKAITNGLTSTTIGATCNWYGTTNVDGQASTLFTGPVTYSPYLNNGTDNEAGTPGFQPVPGSCVSNTPPVATANANQTATVGVAFSYTVNAFTDDTPNSLTYTASINPANNLSFNPATRVISGTPSMSGVSSVTVTATDPGSLTATTTFTITVNPAPVVITPLALTLTASPTMLVTTGTTTLSATVSGGTTPYSYTFTGPGTITASGNTATVSNLPAGVQTFTVVARDATTPTSQTISGTVSVTVTQANTPPVATANANQTATVGVAFSYTVNAFTDNETPTMLTYTASIVPMNGFMFNPATRVISGTPSMSGVSSVTVTASDPSNLSASTSFSITVNPAPIVVTPLALTLTASPTMLTTSGTTTLSATVSGGTTPYSYTFSGPGTISQSPTSNTASVSNIPTGVQTFTVLARDATAPTSQSISGTVSVTITPANTPPVATTNANQTATVGVAFSYTVNAFMDDSPNSLTYSASIVPPNGFSFNPATRVISGTPSMSGVSSVTVTATDPGSLSASTSFTITVSPAPVSPPPTATFSITGVTTISCQTLSVGQRRVTFNPRYAGLDGTPVSFSVVNEMPPTTNPGPYTLNLYTDNPVITLRALQSGASNSFAYNWLSACSSSTGNTPPTVANPVPPQSATVGIAYTLSLANVFTDAETPSGLSLSVMGLPAGLNFVAPSTISGTPSMSGVSSVTVTATDPGSLSASTSFTLTVSPAGATPPPPSGTFSITGVTTVSCEVISAGQRRLTFNPRYAGLNGAPVSFSVVNELAATTSPGPYVLRLYTDNPVITLQAVQSGISSSFAYNWLSACSSSTANTAPTVANPVAPQSATVGVGYTLSLATVFTDAETPNQLSLSVVGLPAGLSFTAPSTISGTPSMSGVSSVTVTATDPGSLSASTSFTITVSPAGATPPPPSGTFSITGVQTVSCEVVSAGQRRLTFNPQYAGLNGAPVSFSVVNELSSTTSPGPYVLRLYTDNPVITLQAVQSGVSASFSYSWLAACNGGARVSAEPGAGLQVRVLGNPIHDVLEVAVTGAEGGTLHLVLTDGQGRSLNQVWIEQATSNQRVRLNVANYPAGVLLLRAATPTQSQTVKVIKAE